MSPRSSSDRTARSRGGFTLLEILVAISIVAIVLVTVYGVFSSVSRAKERLEADAEIYQRVRVIFDRFGREFRGVCPAGGPSRKGVLRTGQDAGGNPTLEITTTATTALGVRHTGIALIRYSVVPDREKPAGKVLLRTEQSALTGGQAMQPPEPMRLADGIGVLEWRFLVKDQWRSDFDADRDGLPLEVELTLAMHDAQGQLLPFRSAFDVPAVAWR